MCCIFAGIGSCLGSCAGSAMCSACHQCAPKKANSRYHYVILVVLGAIISLLLRKYGDDDITIKNHSNSLCELFGHESHCQDNGMVFRIFFCLSVFFGVHSVLTFAWKGFHTHFWILKLCILISSILACYFIDNSFFEGYAEFARVGAAVFLVFQIIIFIDMMYVWNEKWVAEGKYALILGVSFIFFAVTGVLLGFSFHWFGDSGCDLTLTVLSLFVICTVFLVAGSIGASHGAILPCAGVTVYSAYILFTGFAKNTDSKCNSLPNHDTNRAFQVTVGLIFLAMSVTYFCLSATKHQKEQNGNTEEKSKS